jgi:glyoxylase-like metal-dependent hydrolase (beta-lactamase superfamily II)
VGATETKLNLIAPGIHEIRLPVPWEEEIVNCFLFSEGAQVDLLDCGIQSDASVATVLAAIRELGGPEARLRRLVITHIHPDHFGAAGALKDATGVELFMHRLEVPMVHPRYLELEQLIAEVGQNLRLNGVPEPDVSSLQNASRAMREFVRPGEPDVQLDGAETLELGGRRLRVEWTPGHSPGHICLFDLDERLLFAGDQLLPDISTNIALHPQSTPNPLGEFLESLDRLLALQPALVLPSHGRPFPDAAGRVARLHAHHERRLNQIEAILGEEPLSGWEVAIRIWGERKNIWDKRMALQEGLAHLQLLAVQHRVEKLADVSGVRWRKVPSERNTSAS